ncbi:unnamed protein product [Amaranthus hypochondriacus]
MEGGSQRGSLGVEGKKDDCVILESKNDQDDEAALKVGCPLSGREDGEEDAAEWVMDVVDEFEDCFKQVSIEPKDLVEHERGGMGSIIEEMGRPCGSEGLGPEDSMAGCDGLNQGGEEALYHREDTDLGAPKEDDQDVLAGVSQEKKWKRRARIGGVGV